MLGGGLVARVTRKDKTLHQIPEIHAARFGQTPVLRYVLAFFGGVIVLWGARLAGGCTSGHMMSGMMQTAISGYLFAAAVFVVAVPVSLILYRAKGGA
ncbi:MAG: YeeE/YedE thiosulfate transporter family protein [Desulfobacterales bacterium]